MALGVGPGARGDHADVLVLRDRGLRQPARRDAGLRRHRPRPRSTWIRPPSNARCRREPAPSCPCTCSASAPTWSRSSSIAGRAGVPVDRGRGAGDRGALPRTPGRHDGPGRLFLVLSLARISGRSATAGSSRPATRRSRASCGCCATTARSRSTSTAGSAATSGSTRCRRPCCASRRRTCPRGPRRGAATPTATAGCSHDAGLDEVFALPVEPAGYRHIYNQFVIRGPRTRCAQGRT